jgi:hypothetical protein
MDRSIPRYLFNESNFDSLICTSCFLISRQCVSLFLFVWLYSSLFPGLTWVGDFRPSVGPEADQFSHKRQESILNPPDPIETVVSYPIVIGMSLLSCRKKGGISLCKSLVQTA